MTPPSPDDETDSGFETTARRELADRENVVDYEIKESTAEHVLARVVERTEPDSSREREVLYRLEHVHRPGGEEGVRWVDLGPVADDDQ